MLVARDQHVREGDLSAIEVDHHAQLTGLQRGIFGCSNLLTIHKERERAVIVKNPNRIDRVRAVPTMELLARRICCTKGCPGFCLTVVIFLKGILIVTALIENLKGIKCRDQFPIGRMLVKVQQNAKVVGRGVVVAIDLLHGDLIIQSRLRKTLSDHLCSTVADTTLINDMVGTILKEMLRIDLEAVGILGERVKKENIIRPSRRGRLGHA